MPVLLRKPLLLAFVLGCGVSAVASGRFSVRLIVDGAVSFAFLPAIELLSLAVVNAMGPRRRRPFPDTADRFCDGNWPWLLWLAGVAAITALVPPRQSGSWMTVFVLSALAPFAWSFVIDFRFFRDVSLRSTRGAVQDLILFRALGWPLGIAYFFGIAIWSEQLPEFLHWMGL